MRNLKFLKKIVALLVACISLFAFVSCGGKQSESEGNAQFKDRPNKISVTVFNGGYGYEWMNQVANYYMENVDTSTYVEVIPSVMLASDLNKVATGLATSDIYVLDGKIDTRLGAVVELSDVMSSYPTGETAYTIEEKCADITDFYRSEEEIYYMPWGSKAGYSFMYNKTTIDGALGAGNWVLPRTSQEFFEFGDKLVAKGVYLYSGAYGDQYDYLYMGQRIWFAQAIGLEAYEKFMSGYYKNGDNWEFASSSPKMIEQNKEALKSFYEILRTLSLQGTGYTHANSNAMTFTDIEAVFAGYGFGRNKAKTAFIFEGPWGQNEVEMVCSVIGDEFTQETGSMRMPVNSTIINRTPSINDDATLRLVIDYVDGKTTAKPEGVSDDDIAIVAEARNLIGNSYGSSIMIPSTSKVIANAKNFLKFLATDKAQQITMDVLNGVSVLPYDCCSIVEATKPVSNFAIELQANARNAKFIELNNTLYDFARITGFNCYFGTYQITSGIFAEADVSKVKTAEQFYNELYSYYNNRWASMVEAFSSAI